MSSKDYRWSQIYSKRPHAGLLLRRNNDLQRALGAPKWPAVVEVQSVVRVTRWGLPSSWPILPRKASHYRVPWPSWYRTGIRRWSSTLGLAFAARSRHALVLTIHRNQLLRTNLWSAHCFHIGSAIVQEHRDPGRFTFYCLKEVGASVHDSTALILSSSHFMCIVIVVGVRLVRVGHNLILSQLERL